MVIVGESVGEIATVCVCEVLAGVLVMLSPIAAVLTMIAYVSVGSRFTDSSGSQDTVTPTMTPTA
eukprot:7389625-Prymnesium_polylepis.1